MAKYEQDEFDALAQEAGPVGVHRAPRPWWSRLVAPFIVFVLAGALAYGIVAWNWSQSSSSDDDTPAASSTPSASVTSSPSPSASASPSPSVEPSETASPSPSPSETAEPVIEFDAEVHVRNGSGIAGLAGAQQTALEDGGFTNVTANNINLSLIPEGANTVVYSDEALADTAAEIAETLGIDAVLQQDTPGGASIEVLLATDPAA